MFHGHCAITLPYTHNITKSYRNSISRCSGPSFTHFAYHAIPRDHPCRTCVRSIQFNDDRVLHIIHFIVVTQRSQFGFLPMHSTRSGLHAIRGREAALRMSWGVNLANFLVTDHGLRPRPVLIAFMVPQMSDPAWPCALWCLPDGFIPSGL